MISTKQLLYKLDMRLNKVVSLEHQSIPLEDKILALNEAQIKLIKKKLNSNNIYQQGLDAFKKRYNDLQNLVVPFEELDAIEDNSIGYKTYKASVNDLEHSYFVPLDLYAACDKGECTDRPIYINKIVKHGDISVLMSNSSYAPSFEYQETFAVVTDDFLVVYTDGTFTTSKIYLSYLRYPLKIDSEGYIHFDESPSVNQDCELKEDLEDELLDLVVLELAMSTENIPAVQFSEIRNKNNE